MKGFVAVLIETPNEELYLRPYASSGTDSKEIGLNETNLEAGKASLVRVGMSDRMFDGIFVPDELAEEMDSDQLASEFEKLSGVPMPHLQVILLGWSQNGNK